MKQFCRAPVHVGTCLIANPYLIRPFIDHYRHAETHEITRQASDERPIVECLLFSDAGIQKFMNLDLRITAVGRNCSGRLRVLELGLADI